VRIAINAAFLGGREEGIATYARSVIDDLSRSGHETFVYTSERMELGGNGLTKWRRTSSSLRAEAGPMGNILRAAVWSQTALPARVLRDRAQVLLSTLPEGMLVPACPQVMVVHDLFPLFFPDIYPRWKHYFRHMLPRVLKASSGVIADSEHTKQDLVHHMGVPKEKITVVYPWVDPLFLSDDTGKPPEGYEPEPYFLYVGRLSPYKNLEMVIRAFAAVCREVQEKLVCVLGYFISDNSAYYSEILDLAARLGVRDRLRVYSGLSRAQLVFLYRNATALVLLSKYEGFGYPPLEAMAMGTPAIVSDSTSLAEVAGPGAVCVPYTEPDPAAEAMKRLACDPAYRSELGEAGKAHARQFSRERSGRMIRSILERCGKGAA
jgi:glycosyltransferase involved in cell wall biosynthesis